MVIEVNCRNAADIRPISSFFFSLFRCLIYEVDRSNVNKLCHAFDCDPCTFIKSRQNFGVILQNIWQPHAGTSKLWRFHDLIANIFGTQQDDKRKTSLQTVITPTQGIYLIGQTLVCKRRKIEPEFRLIQNGRQLHSALARVLVVQEYTHRPITLPQIGLLGIRGRNE